MNPLKKLPLPVCGVALALAALGNLIQSYSEGLRLVCGAISGILLIAFIVKCVAYPQALKDDMANPIMASVSGTFCMAWMLLAAYLKPFIGDAAIAIWYLAIALHVALIVYFTAKFVLHFEFGRVFASWYIVYVGIAVAGVSAPAFGQEAIGAATFWFGLASLVVLLVVVTMRYAKAPEPPEPARPLICIYAAPTSLCIAAYVQSVTPKSLTLLLVLWVLATVLYLFSLIQCLRLSKKFFPSWAAFTFPFVISAIASKQLMACAAKLESPLPWLSPIVSAQTIIAAVLVIYVLVRYLMFVFAKPAPQATGAGK